MIKISILFVCLATALYTPSAKLREVALQRVTRYQMECVEQTRVDSDVIAKIKRKDWKIPTNQKRLVADWALCVLMKSGIMTKEGVYKSDIALKMVPPSDRPKVERQIDKCLTPKPIPAPDIAYRFIKCFQKAKSNHSAFVSAM